MNEDFIREVENYCRWIVEELRNFRHSDECIIGHCLTYESKMRELLERKEEEIESIN